MDKKAVHKISYGLYVVGSKKDGKFEGCVVNSIIQLTSNPMTLALSCVNENYTCEAIKESKEFSVSILSQDVDPFVIGNFGFESGRDGVYKWSKVPLELFNNIPVVKGSAGYLHCKVKDMTDLGTHTLFICEIADAKDGVGTALTYEYYQTNLKKAALNAFNKSKGIEVPEETGGEKWVCKICGYVYSGAVPFEDLPDDWVCPLCKHPKSDFEKQ